MSVTITKVRENAKALASLTGSLATFLAAVNAPPQYVLWIGGLGTVLTGLATWGVPNLPKGGTTPVDESVLGQVQAAVQNRDSLQSAAADANSALEKIAAGVTQAVGATPAVGPPTAAAINLVEQFIKSTRR